MLKFDKIFLTTRTLPKFPANTIVESKRKNLFCSYFFASFKQKVFQVICTFVVYFYILGLVKDQLTILENNGFKTAQNVPEKKIQSR